MNKKILSMAAIAIAVATLKQVGDDEISVIANELKLDKKSVLEMVDEVRRAHPFAIADMRSGN